MQLSLLQRRVIMDARVMHEAVDAVFPVKMPKQYRDSEFNLGSFLKKINARSEPLGVLNVIESDLKHAYGKATVALTAQWIPEDNLPQDGSSSDIRLEWHVTKNSRRQRWDVQQWRYRRFYFWTYLLHELVHRHQDIQRGESSAFVYRARAESEALKEEQLYLGDYDEIEAHAHDVALEMHMWYPKQNFREALGMIKNNQQLKLHNMSSTYQIYTHAFSATPAHPAIKVFNAKVRGWWNVMAEEEWNQFYTKTLRLGVPLV